MVDLPLTVTVNEQNAELLAASVTVYLTVFVPIPISFGSFVSTLLPSMVSTTVKESFLVIPGAFATSELSLNSKVQFTVATFFPLSLSAVSVGPGQVSVGGLKSR